MYLVLIQIISWLKSRGFLEDQIDVMFFKNINLLLLLQQSKRDIKVFKGMEFIIVSLKIGGKRSRKNGDVFKAWITNCEVNVNYKKKTETMNMILRT